MDTPNVGKDKDPQGRLSDDGNPLHKSTMTMAQQIAEAARIFEHKRTGVVPKYVSVVYNEGTLVITIHGALSPAEVEMGKTEEGAIRMKEFHRELFDSASQSLREEIKRITGMEVREAAAEIEPKTGSVIAVFSSGTVVQVYLMAGDIDEKTWSGAKAAPAS